MSGADYAGDLSPQESWDILEKEKDARLIDVRSLPEWTFVGIPDLKALGKMPVLVSWQVFPNMQQNPEFVDQVAASGVEKEAPLLFICRSGGRSRMAAMAMAAKGYARCYNVASGFEGDHDATGHRGKASGWKADGLPWVQE